MAAKVTERRTAVTSPVVTTPPGSRTVDTDRYPLHRRDLAASVAAIDPLLRSVRDTGYAVAAGFVRPDARQALIDDAERLAPLGHRSGGVGVRVASDVFGAGSPLRALYDGDELRDFVADVAATELYRSSDPLAGVNVVVGLGADRFVTTDGDDEFVMVVVIRPARGEVTIGSGVRTLDLASGDALILDSARAVLTVEMSGSEAFLLATLPFHRRRDHRPADSVVLARYGRIGVQRRR